MDKVTIVIVDKDGKYLNKVLEGIQVNSNYPYKIIIANAGEPLDIMNVHVIQSTGGSISRDFKEALMFVDTEFVVGLGSDTVPQKDWLKIAMESYRTNFGQGNGVLCLNDTIQDGKVACMVLTTMKTIEEELNGELYDTRFKHYYNDTLLTAIARHKGIYAYCPESVVEHKWEMDEGERKRCWNHDRDLYYATLKEMGINE